MCVNICYLSVLLLMLPVALTVSVNDCQGVKYAYRERGLDLRNVPRQPTQGSQLQICPRGLTCCTEEMETQLRTSSSESYKRAMQAAASSVQRLFNTRANKFDDFFTDLLAASKLKFHKLFQKTYGIIYERNSDVFIDFFKDLEEYYDTGDVDLESALNNFFSKLYQRMFIVFNAQFSFDFPYLSCVSQTMKKLQPFGDVPKKLTEQLRRSFVATRTYAQALLQGKQVLNKILKINPKSECVVALTKMSSCPACQGIPEVRPCSDYCINVMKGCLAYHSQLDESWDKFIENLQTLSDRLVGPFDIESVVDPIGVKISDAIMNFQNSGFQVTTKVFQDCGNPRMQKRQAPYGYAYGRQDDRAPSAVSTDNPEESKLKSLIKEIKESLHEATGFWTQLPHRLCEDDSVGGAQGQMKRHTDCWNGKDKGQYASQVVSDGLVYQDANPEVSVDISRPDVDINEQIFELKLMSKKMEKAYNGQHVDWPSQQKGSVPDTYSPAVPSEEDPTMEGSGYEDCGDDEDCYYDYYDEGSGSGQPHDDKKSDEENWPPWVTAKPKKTETDKDNEINIEDNQQRYPNQKNTVTATKTNAGVANNAFRGIVYYLVPLVTCLIGSALTW